IVAAAGFASCLPASRAWPLPTGLGGVIGDALLRIPAALARAPLSGVPRITVATLLGAGALLGLAFTMGFLWHRPGAPAADDETPTPVAEDEAERSSISLGWLYHWFFSLKARLLRPSTWGWWRRREHSHESPPTAPAEEEFVEEEEPEGEADDEPEE